MDISLDAVMCKGIHLFPDGIPSETAYNEILGTPLFKQMEIYSDEFIRSYKHLLLEYSAKWVADPFHQWSRQWEYPFVATRVHQFIEDCPSARILDAGSGITFFPYFISQHYADSCVVACDQDDAIGRLFASVNRFSPRPVNFTLGDIRSLPFENDSFDLIYSVSVLEHTTSREHAISEFARILKPGGKLVVTFDISLDGLGEISILGAGEMLDSLAQRFLLPRHGGHDLDHQLTSCSLLTTKSAEVASSRLLPWKKPSLVKRIKSRLLNTHIPAWLPVLTVFCITLEKRSD